MILIFAFILATPLSNAVPIGSGSSLCQEPSCVITATSAPAVLQFGATGKGWCPMALIAPTLPLTVNYTTNKNLCPSDPANGVIKGIVAMQQTAAYTITYTLNGVLQPVFTVPALVLVPPPAKTVLKILNCTPGVTLTTYTDGSFSLNASTVMCK